MTARAWTAWPALLVLLAVLGASSPATAALTCEVQVIHAKEASEPHVDKALGSLAQYLKESFGNRYQSFEQVDRGVLKMEKEELASMPLPEEGTLQLQFVEVKEGFIRVRMWMPHLRTTVKIRDGGLFFQAGHAYKGGILILAIRGHLD